MTTMKTTNTTKSWPGVLINSQITITPSTMMGKFRLLIGGKSTDQILMMFTSRVLGHNPERLNPERHNPERHNLERHNPERHNPERHNTEET